jgi:hypothetical protein
MEQVKIKDVKIWLENQIGSTLMSKRRKVFGSCLRKRLAKIVVHEPAEIIERNAICF